MLAQGYEDFRAQGQSLKGMLSEIEQDLIARALEETGGNVSRCAKLLKMQRTTLIERIKKYELRVAEQATAIANNGRCCCRLGPRRIFVNRQCSACKILPHCI